MTFGNEIIFLMLSLIVLGMTANAVSMYEGAREARPSKALMATFVFANLGALAGILYAWVSPLLLTLANTAVLASAWCAALTTRSWRVPLSTQVVVGSTASMVAFTLIFEFLRQNGGYLERVVFFTAASAAILSWLFYEAWQSHQRQKSFQLKFLMAVALASLVLRMARLFVVMSQTEQPATLFQEGALPSLLRLSALSMDILILSALLGYSTLVLAQRYQASKMDNDRVREDNEALNTALAEKNQMLKALTLSAKSNNLGVLLASLVHEINQPLQALQLRTELLSSLPNMPTEQRQQLIKDVDRDTQRLSDIIKQLRRFLKNGAEQRERVAMSGVVNDAIALMKNVLERHEIVLEQDIGSPLYVIADEGQLQMVVLNLLKNARDALQAQPLPRRLVVKLAQHETELELTVADNGPGIPPAKRAQVFELFHSTKAEGMGLGLWLSHTIVQHHGGTLCVDTSPMGGALFTLRLPKANASGGGSNTVALDPASSAG